jgi:site-specific recombinase XerD
MHNAPRRPNCYTNFMKKTTDASERVADLIPEWERSLRARNRAARTVESYIAILGTFDKWLADNDYSSEIDQIDRATVESYLAAMLDRGASGATAARDYRYLRVFFEWAITDDCIERSPMERMSPPKSEEKITPIPDDALIKQLLGTCSSKEFIDIRDDAMIRFMLATGSRLAEVAGLSLEDVSLDVDTALIRGKGSKQRVVTWTDKTHGALRKYLRARKNHPKAELDAFWIGRVGAVTGDGIQTMFRRRSERAGIDPAIHPHQLRHKFSHDHLSNGGNETDLMDQGGWSSPQMLQRYGKAGRSERAIANRKALAIDNKY